MAAGKAYWAVDINGAADFMNRLKRFDRDAALILEREMRKAAEVVSAEARSNMPSEVLSNWGPWTATKDNRDLGYDGGRAAAGIKPRTRTRSRKGTVQSFKVSVQEMDPAGAIFMLAGSVSGTKPGRGVAFKGNVNNKHGHGPKGSGVWPRVLGPARNEKGADAADKIEMLIQRAMYQVDEG